MSTGSEDDIVPALGQSQKKSQKESYQNQPVTNPNFGSDSSRKNSQNESKGNAEHINDGEVLQAARILKVQKHVQP